MVVSYWSFLRVRVCKKGNHPRTRASEQLVFLLLFSCSSQEQEHEYKLFRRSCPWMIALFTLQDTEKTSIAYGNAYITSGLGAVEPSDVATANTGARRRQHGPPDKTPCAHAEQVSQALSLRKCSRCCSLLYTCLCLRLLDQLLCPARSSNCIFFAEVMQVNPVTAQQLNMNVRSCGPYRVGHKSVQMSKLYKSCCTCFPLHSMCCKHLFVPTAAGI